jgi:hypothetical protein
MMMTTMMLRMVMLLLVLQIDARDNHCKFGSAALETGPELSPPSGRN